MSLTQVVPAQQSLLPARQSCPRAWQRQVPIVAPMGRSQSMYPQHSSEFMHDCPLVRQAQLPPLQVLMPQHSELLVHDTCVDDIESAG